MPPFFYPSDMNKHYPKEIWLQADPDGDSPAQWPDTGDVTWSADKINENDLRYILAPHQNGVVGLAREELLELTSLNNALNTDRARLMAIVQQQKARLDAYASGTASDCARAALYAANKVMAERDELLAVVERCREVFATYADHHAAKPEPDPEKVARNRELAAMCEAAVAKFSEARQCL